MSPLSVGRWPIKADLHSTLLLTPVKILSYRFKVTLSLFCNWKLESGGQKKKNQKERLKRYGATSGREKHMNKSSSNHSCWAGSCSWLPDWSLYLLSPFPSVCPGHNCLLKESCDHIIFQLKTCKWLPISCEPHVQTPHSGPESLPHPDPKLMF